MTRKEIIEGLLSIHAVTANYSGDQVILHNMPMPRLTAILNGAAELLKAEEPRVMTLSGVRNLKESTPVWLEDVDKKDTIGALFARDYSGTKCVDFAIVRDWEFERVVADYMDYGVRWRCWTRRPTPEQMEAAPWRTE